jgi:hypothetical protein
MLSDTSHSELSTLGTAPESSETSGETVNRWFDALLDAADNLPDNPSPFAQDTRTELLRDEIVDAGHRHGW